MIFNGKGKATSYFKSQCYNDLAIKTLAEKYCDQVIERPSLFFDGAYYSPQACRDRIHMIKKDAATSKMESARIHRLQKIIPVIKDGNLVITLALNDSDINGEYALDVTALYHDRNNAEVSESLNPEGAGIRYDQSFARLLAVNAWILPLRAHQKNVTFTIPKNYFPDAVDDIQLKIKLQFLQADNGSIANPLKRPDYISAIVVPLNH